MTQLTVTTKVYAPLAKVREKRTNPADVMQRNAASDDWHCPAARNDLQVGGTFAYTMAARDGSFSFDYAGAYSKIVPMESIEFVLGDMKEYDLDAGRKVYVTFHEDGSCGCVEVSETFDVEEIHSLEQQKAGWQAILERFKGHVESSS